MIAASIMAGLGIAALGLVVVLPCVIAWMASFTAGLCMALLIGRNSVPFEHMLSILFTIGVAIFGVLAVARWAFNQMKTNADVGSQSESASLLLQEYEQRGVGWLWQVDSENRVTYISSRMTALLGRPANQLLGHSLPSLLGGHAELGRKLLDKQAFNSLEMELETARGPRWISIAGDPIIDTAGRFEGFRGVGSDVTEIRQTQERLTHLANIDVLVGPSQPRPGAPAARRCAACCDAEQRALRDPFPRPRRVQAGQRHLRPPEGRRSASRSCQAAGRRGRRRRPCRPHGRRRIRHRHHRRAKPRQASRRWPQRIIDAIKQPYMIDGTEIRIGVSIGCAFGPIDGATVDDLILKADLALYQAKDAGRGVARYFSSELQSEQEDRVRMENRPSRGARGASSSTSCSSR